MTINGETLRSLRGALTREELGKKARGVSAKTIGRIEGGKTTPRANTVKRLAKALGVTPEVLADPPAALAERERDEKLRSIGFRKLSTHVPGRAALALDLVERRYGVSVRSQLELAPLVFTILAETSLAARRRRLENMQAAHEAYLAAAPSHLNVITADHEDASGYESDSINARDLFGNELLESPVEPFDPDASNPFFDFLREAIRDLEAQGAGAIAELDRPGPDGLPDAYHTQVLPELLDEIAGGDRYARAALEDGDVRIGDIPKELWEEERAGERAAWLAARCSPETRKRLDIPIKL